MSFVSCRDSICVSICTSSAFGDPSCASFPSQFASINLCYPCLHSLLRLSGRPSVVSMFHSRCQIPTSAAVIVSRPHIVSASAVRVPLAVRPPSEVSLSPSVHYRAALSVHPSTSSCVLSPPVVSSMSSKPPVAVVVSLCALYDSIVGSDVMCLCVHQLQLY